MTDLLFVYGTLRGEFDNPPARSLRAKAESLGAATVTGALYRVASYPGFRPDTAGVVHGEIYRLGEPAATLAALDEYEGPEYRRVLADTVFGPVWVYTYDAPVREEQRIESGDFCHP